MVSHWIENINWILTKAQTQNLFIFVHLKLSIFICGIKIRRSAMTSKNLKIPAGFLADFLWLLLIIVLVICACIKENPQKNLGKSWIFLCYYLFTCFLYNIHFSPSLSFYFTALKTGGKPVLTKYDWKNLLSYEINSPSLSKNLKMAKWIKS